MSSNPVRTAGQRPRMACAVSLLVLAGGLIGATGSAHAAPLNLPETPYAYAIVDQDLGAALQEFGTNLGIRVNVSPEVRGRLQGKLPELRPRQFLNRLASMFNLDWYYDGQILYVTSARETQSRLLVLAPITYDRFRSVISALGISDDRYTVRPAPGNGLVLVSGPPRFVTLVEQTLAALITEEQARPKPVAAPPPPRREVVFGVYRGAQTTIIRDGRLDQIFGPDSRPEARADAGSRAGSDGSALAGAKAQQPVAQPVQQPPSRGNGQPAPPAR